MTNVAGPDRFAFGENWWRFLALLDETRIIEAERSLTEMLGTENLNGLSFCDVGSGSGLFSLAARRLGATVRSFDFDPASVACTAELRRRFFPSDPNWSVESGSALDPKYLERLGRFDVVYAWGVLHHTGAMWEAMKLASALVKPAGLLYIALYNDQGWRSNIWRFVKRSYNALPKALRFLIVLPILVLLWGRLAVRDFARGRPFSTWREYSSTRGMSPWHDLIDWVGGYPFEVARPDDVIHFYERLGFGLREIRRRNGLGCNEFVFAREH
ncbi:MAG: class I SAM-dependent methyltransferase [Chloroflexota bacterium]